ncbi:MAG: ice-binding family protein [Pseudomonadota bacterium]
MIHAPHPCVKALTPGFGLFAFPLVALLVAACGGSDAQTHEERSSTGAEQVGSVADSAESAAPATDTAEAGVYRGPSVGAAKGFAALAYSAITAVTSSPITGNLGVSGAPVRSITGFDEVPAMKFGTDSSSPNSLRTILTQREVDALVDDLDVRACDANYSDVAGDVTLHPGVTCVNGLQADLRLSGRVTLDAGGDPNAFFVIRSDSSLTIADETVLVLANGAQGCGVFWQGKMQVTIGRNVAFVGTLIAGTGIAMHSGSTLLGRALAQTADVVLDGNAITVPTYDSSGSGGKCAHLQ